MKSIRTRMTVIFVGLMMAMIAVIWGINKWYLEKYYITEKVESIEAAYDAFNWQLESNAERGISIQEAMKREQDADGNIKEGNLQKLFRDFSDKANVSMLMIDNSADSSAVYSTARDAKFLRDRMERYIFGKNRRKRKKERYPDPYAGTEFWCAGSVEISEFCSAEY